MLKAASILLSLVVCASANAQTHGPAIQLVKEMRYGQAFDDAKRECLDRVDSLDVGALLKDTPDLFGGIMPGHKLWPEAEALYKEMVADGCNLDKNVAEQAFAAELSSNLSSDEIQKLLEFYRSDLGQSFVRASILANDAANRAMSPDINSNAAYKRYEQGVAELLSKNRDENGG